MFSRNHLFKRVVLIVCALLLVGIPYAPDTNAESGDRLVRSTPINIGNEGGVTDYQPTSDGGYIAAVGPRVAKIDASGQLEWSTMVTDPDQQVMSVRETAWGYLFAGTKANQFMYGKLDQVGIVTHLRFGVHDMGAATSITEAGNDGYVISGYERRNLGDELNPLLVRTDRNGMELARTSIPIPGNQFVYDAFPAGGTEPDVILVGSTDGNSKAQGYLAKVKSSASELGTVVWQKSYGENGSSRYTLLSGKRANDASGQPGYVVTGNEVSGFAGQNALLLFTGLDGEEKWLRTYPGSPRLGLEVKQTKDGGFAIAGGNNGSTGFLYKTDVDGNPQWQKEWPDTGNLRTFLQLANGNYQLAGGNQAGLLFQVWVGPPIGLAADDAANRISGLDETMEYSTDGGSRYEPYVSGQEPTFDGDVSVLVRYKADPASGYETGEPKSFTFTVHSGNPGNPGLPPGYSYSQDGVGFSGMIETQPLGDKIVMTGHDDWPNGFSKGPYAFAGGVFDGKNIWMIPSEADRVIRLDPATGQMTGYNGWPDDFQPQLDRGAFRGGVFDGESIWLIPYGADRVIKLDGKTGEMTGFNSWPAGFNKQSSAFSGGIYDGQNIWMIPYSADRIVKLDKATGKMTGYNNWPGGFSKSYAAFAGGVYDGRNIWMIPMQADRVIKLDTVTGEMTGYSSWPDGFTKNPSITFVGGTYDGENIWMIPYNSGQVIKLDASTGQMTGYPVEASSQGFASGIYDGESIWMIPYDSDRVIRIDKATGEMTRFNNWPHGFAKQPTAFFSSVYDGKSIWMIPYFADRVVKVSTAPLTYTLTYDGNGATGGSVPIDSDRYEAGTTATVLDNTGSLEKAGYTFAGWNTAADGSGTDYAPGASYIIAGDATLYAKWVQKSGNTDLRSLTLSSGVLDPDFAADTRRYTARVAHNISEVTVTAETADDNATATVSVSDSTGTLVSGPLPLTNGTASPPLPLDVGTNTLTVEVTAQDGTTKSYAVKVTREQPNLPPPPTPPPYYPVIDISLDETDLTFTTGDEPVQLNATILPSYATNREVTWRSSDPDVASVGRDGTVTPKAPGTAVITATTVDGNKSVSCSVTVKEKVKPFRLETSEKEILVKPRYMVSFKVFAVYPDGKRKEVTSSGDTEYSSSASLLTVTPGRIKAGKKEGNATVTITYRGEEQKIAVNVTKTSVNSLSVSPKKLSLKKGDTKQLELTAKLAYNDTRDVTERAVWTSRNEKVATVSDTGEVVAVGAGTTSIQAIYGGKRLYLQVSVTSAEPELNELTVSKRVVRLDEGEREQVTLTAFYEDGSKKDVTLDAKWTSDAKTIAIVSDGEITGIKVGKTRITASYQNRKITVTVHVQQVESAESGASTTGAS